MNKKIVPIICLLLMPFMVFAEKVKVRVFSTAKIESTKISFEQGKYTLVTDDIDIIANNLKRGDFLEVSTFAKEVIVSINGEKKGKFSNITLVAQETGSYLNISPKNYKQRSYEDNLYIKAFSNKNLILINEVEFESYITGVVQSEIYGKPDQTDIFRVQAIISRTWAMRNMEKHKTDGYNFCDNVHCQAYYNRCIKPEIVFGATQSIGEVLVDYNNNLIETPFHSNSGGQTSNSEDVWQASIPYLRSVPDTFSYGMKQSVWKKEFTTTEWLNYFAKTHKLDISKDSIRNGLVNFVQDERKAKIMNVPLKTVRNDLKLKSTFFSVFYYGDKVVLEGRGYGHGVGLSQEGAIRMVELGFPYQDILIHYYTDARVKRIGEPEPYLAYVDEIEKILGEPNAPAPTVVETTTVEKKESASTKATNPKAIYTKPATTGVSPNQSKVKEEKNNTKNTKKDKVVSKIQETNEDGFTFEW